MYPARLALLILACFITPCIAQAQEQYYKNRANVVVLDMDNDGVLLHGKDSKGAVYWDFDIDGFAEACGWIGNSDAFLVIDYSNDGLITNHTDMLGGMSQNGIDRLLLFDNNNDGIINHLDPAYFSLKLWFDANNDGYAVDRELKSLPQTGIIGIFTNAGEYLYSTPGGRYKKTAMTISQDGKIRPLYSIALPVDNVNAIFNKDYTLDIRTLFLPTLRGYGVLPDLHIAMSLDESLLNLTQKLATAEPGYFFSHHGILDMREILFRWAHKSRYPPTNRGPNINPYLVNFIERQADLALSRNHSIFDPVVHNLNRPESQTLQIQFSKFLLYRFINFVAQANPKFIFEEDGTYNPMTDIIDGTFENLQTDNLRKLFLEDAKSTEEKIYSWLLLSAYLDILRPQIKMSTEEKDFLISLLGNSFPDMAISMDVFEESVRQHTAILHGTNRMHCRKSVCVGTLFDDDVEAGPEDNIIFSLDGDDIILAGSGDDTVYASNGAKQIRLGDGNDRIVYAGGSLLVMDEAGKDSITVNLPDNHYSFHLSDNSRDIEIHFSENDKIILGNYFSKHSWQNNHIEHLFLNNSAPVIVAEKACALLQGGRKFVCDLSRGYGLMEFINGLSQKAAVP